MSASSRFLPVVGQRHRQPFSFSSREGSNLSSSACRSEKQRSPSPPARAIPEERSSEHEFWNDGGDQSNSNSVSRNFARPSDPVVPRATGARTQGVPLDQKIAASTEPSGRDLQLIQAGPQLVPLTVLPDRYRCAFRFPLFNKVQSICFENLFNGDDNVVVSAPTGSGKTTLFELALIRMLVQSSDDKAVYMAPTKALCSERAQDWQSRFEPVGCPIVELTGDSRFSGLDAAYRARIIVTTPEKWDSLTRNWAAHRKLLDKFRLFLIDEIHTLQEKTRGACLEIVVARMCTFGNNVRIVAVSATIPNSADIAEWIGRRSSRESSSERAHRYSSGHAAPLEAAKSFCFGEEYRPVALQRTVLGFKSSGDEWTFQSILNQKLFEVVRVHSMGKPTLVFVPTRKATMQAAEKVKEGYLKHSETSHTPWRKPSEMPSYSDARLGELAALGIAYHHAGLTLQDRKTVEAQFLKGNITALCCTSTLAVGVNLPAFCVIVRGTKRYHGSWTELPELDLIQMMGRAGRPQYDKEGIAVILTEESKVDYYKNLVSGQTKIESTLHEELVEHVNSEIGLRVDCTVADIERWLQRTFLYVRMQKNPSYYCQQGEDGGKSPLQVLQGVCAAALSELATHELVTTSDRGALSSTDFGEILSKYYISFDTMLELLQLHQASMKDLLAFVSRAKEFADIRIRQGERAAYVALKSNSEIRFPPDKIGGVADKVNLIIQGILSALPLQRLLKTETAPVNPVGDILIIFRHCPQIVKAALDAALSKKDVTTLNSALDLLRSINGRAWDNSSATLRQIEGIGEKSIKIFATSGILSYKDLGACEPYRIEHLLNRKPPFGHKVISIAAALPHLSLDVKEVVKPSRKRKHDDGDSGQSVVVTVQVTIELLKAKNVVPKTKSREGMPFFCTVFAHTSDNQVMLDYRRTPLRTLSESKSFQIQCCLTSADQSIVIKAACDEVAGSAVRKELKPDVDPAWFPPPEPRSTESRELPAELQGLEDCHDLFKDDWHSDGQSQNSAAGSQPLTAPVDPLLQSEKLHKKVKPMRQTKLQSAIPIEIAEQEPPRLSNGNYQCRHRCKASCRHLCCREGLPNPPATDKSGKRKGAKDRVKADEENRSVLDRLEQLAGVTSSESDPLRDPARSKKGLVLPRKTFPTGLDRDEGNGSTPSGATDGPSRVNPSAKFSLETSLVKPHGRAESTSGTGSTSKRAALWGDLPIMPGVPSDDGSDIMDEVTKPSPSPPAVARLIASLGRGAEQTEDGSEEESPQKQSSKHLKSVRRQTRESECENACPSVDAFMSVADLESQESEDELEVGFPLEMIAEATEPISAERALGARRDEEASQGGQSRLKKCPTVVAERAQGESVHQHASAPQGARRQQPLFLRTSPLRTSSPSADPAFKNRDIDAHLQSIQEPDFAEEDPEVEDHESLLEDEEHLEAWLLAHTRDEE
ncbi:P-loop containing nucleoside triphosphate hydrolase protein [Microstroma glucosiphilum]|uniref:DNA 3'-5' helicase n=1 Tax=Pseudomicrostroma glucosiphilum TaxID=1684307 RepID=A0A316UDP8_9BASI|nr:P-loop containing nucleoside triphosphate hydrolase protein [Pseudomicrostroma glucosiphilum]PWN23387.1 P-loop containing nucleoside triphosphate hydrolase protein [Pseudomicrostroma glucosiphilum]